jgi:hypothetical protein
MLKQQSRMTEINEYRDFCGKAVLRVFGVCALLFFLAANPLVLRPRSWNMAVAVRSTAIDAAVFAGGAGLILLRRWAAILTSALAAYIAILLLSSTTGLVEVCLSLLLLIPLVLTVVFWRILVWGDRFRDPLLVLATIGVSALVYYTAFILSRRV